MNMSSIEPYFFFLIISSQFGCYLVLQLLQTDNLLFDCIVWDAASMNLD